MINVADKIMPGKNRPSLDWRMAAYIEAKEDDYSHYSHKDCLIQWATRVGVGDIPDKKTCPLCRKLYLNIMVKSNLWGEEELIDVDQPAPQASDHEEDFDWDLLRLNAPAPLPDHPREIMRPG